MSSQWRTRLTSLSLPTPRGPMVPLPTSCLFKFVALHAVFNQQELWEAFIDEGIVSYSDRSIKEAGIPSLLRRFKRNGKKTRSSNYRAIQLQQISADGVRTWRNALAAPAVRDTCLLGKRAVE